MVSARRRQLQQMSPDQVLEFMRATAVSLAGAIQDYQGMQLKMIDDRQDVVDFIEVDGQSIADAVREFDMDLFLTGAKGAIKVERRVTAKALREGSFNAAFEKKRGRATTGQRGGTQS